MAPVTPPGDSLPISAEPAESGYPVGAPQLRAGRGRPVFLFSGGGADVQELAQLVVALRTQRPLVGVPYWEAEESGRAPATVESMADGALRRVLLSQHDGRFSLVGYSLGALVAVEVARRLVEVGKSVAPPILIDPLTDKGAWPPLVLARFSIRYAFNRAFGRRPRAGSAPDYTEVEKRCRAAKARYRPMRYDGPVAVVHAAREPNVGGLAPAIWRRTALEVDDFPVPSSHLELVRSEAAVADLAKKVDRYLDDGSDEKRRALVLTGVSWHATARLARQLQRVGFVVEALAPHGHPLSRQEGLAGFHVLPAIGPQRSIEIAIGRSRPDLLIPGDDFVTDLLHRLHATTQSPVVRATIERSLGSPEFFGRKFDRLWMNDLAASEGVAVPRTEAVASPTALGEQVDRIGLPAFLKVDGSWGGLGVARVGGLVDARRAWRRLSSPRHGLRAVKRALLNGDVSGVDRLLRGRRPAFSVQEAVDGELVVVSAACYRGELLGMISARVLAQQTAFGPATKIQLDDRLPVRDAVAKIVRRLGLSGLCGFDFILSPTQTVPVFIELNPRATQTSDFIGETDGDFLARLLDAFGGRGTPRRRTFSNGALVTMANVTDDADDLASESSAEGNCARSENATG